MPLGSLRPPMQLAQRAFQICDHSREIMVHSRTGPTNQNIVPTRATMLRHHLPRHCTQAALGAIARDSIADFLGTGVANANKRGLVAVPGLQQKRRAWRPFRFRSAQKIGTLLQSFDSHA